MQREWSSNQEELTNNLREWQERQLPGAGILHIAYSVHSAYCILSAARSTASFFRIWNSSTGILSLLGASEELRP